MEELLRFVTIRSATKLSSRPSDFKSAQLSISTDSSFQEQINSAKDSEREPIASKQAKKSSFVSDLAKLKIPVTNSQEFEELRLTNAEGDESALLRLIAAIFDPSVRDQEDLEPAELRQLIEEQISSKRWQNERQKLFDSAMVLAYHQPKDLSSAANYEEAIKFIYLAEAAAKDDFNSKAAQPILQGVLDSEHRWPVEEFVEPKLDDDDEPVSRNEEAYKNAAKVNKINRAADFLLTVPRSELEAKVSRTEDKPQKKTAKAANVSAKAARQPEGVAFASESVSYHLKKSSLETADEAIRPYLEAAIDNNSELDTSQVSMALRHQEREIYTQAFPMQAKRIKGTTITPSLANNYVLPDFIKNNNNLFTPEYGIKPEIYIPGLKPIGQGPRYGSLGVGELLIVKQQLKQYESLDVAHIENILRGELKERTHQRRRLTEESYLTETESEVEEERDTQTSERFELKSEVSEEVNEKLGFEAGLKVTAQLGPFVELEANAKFSYENAKNSSRKKASSFSKETTERASSRYAERMLERRERRLVEEVIEKNVHSINAEGAAQHTSGVYQWVNKIYEAQVYNYGIRQMYEFFIPEPALYYIRSLVSKTMTDGEALTPPPAFNINPGDITRGNYKLYTALYKASGVPAPPEEFVKVDMAQAGGPLDFDSTEEGNVASAFSVQIPDGYEYHGYSSSWRYTYRGDADFQLRVSENYGDAGTVPVFVKGFRILSWACWVHIRCRLTASADDDWRLKAWESLKDGYDQMQREYEDQLAASAVQQGVEIAGRNPGANKRIVKEEIQRQCISAFTNNTVQAANGISGAGGVPTINWSQAYRQGSYARFMHHAFEWENMTYVFYPFFWARSDRWLELFNIEDADPDFQSFLQSGMVRVVVPVRPEFEAHIEYFKRNKKIWSGAKPPVIGDKDFLSVVAEIQANTGAPGNEEPIGDSWDIRVPTQLIKLRKDDQLPKWKKDESGDWVEDNGD